MTRYGVVIALFLFWMAPPIFAGQNPIAGLPYYNGTNWGTPGTGGNCDSGGTCDSTAGRQMFSTLFRDNYGESPSGGTPVCTGERCGSHAGTDIAVKSGTSVVAALSGKVVVAECKEGPGTGNTGGTVVIEANNPYASNDKVYVVYAHLRAWSVSKNQTVTQGVVIGETGGEDGLGANGQPNGKTPDYCRGASYGPHLHFQVDRNPPDASDRPWFPLTGAATPDSNFVVSDNTHNPLPFVTGIAYPFTFAENGNAELWGAQNVTAYGISADALWVDSSSSVINLGRSSHLGDVSCGQSAPCSREITLDANIFKRMILTVDLKCANNPGVILYRGPDNVWRAGGFNYSVAGTYQVMLSPLTYWNGIITDVMIRPSQGCTANPGPNEAYIKQMYFLP